MIDAVGEGAAPWKVGDAVVAVAAQGSGSYAEYALASTAAIAAKPKKMSFEEASGIPVVAETAWRAVVTVGNVQKGQRVLIHGAAGGVGSSAVQFAKARGAYVIGTASARNHAFLKSLGVDETIDYTTTRFETEGEGCRRRGEHGGRGHERAIDRGREEGRDAGVGCGRAVERMPCAAAGIKCTGVGSVNGSDAAGDCRFREQQQVQHQHRAEDDARGCGEGVGDQPRRACAGEDCAGGVGGCHLSI